MYTGFIYSVICGTLSVRRSDKVNMKQALPGKLANLITN